MPLQPAITDLEQLRSHPAIAKLLAWNPAAVEEAKFGFRKSPDLKWFITCSRFQIKSEFG